MFLPGRMKGCISFFHVGAARTIDDESLHLSSGAASARPTPPGPALTTFESGGCGDAMPESANDASGTRFSDDDGGDDDDDDDERADIVDEYRARIRYCLPLALSRRFLPCGLWYYAHTLSRYDNFILLSTKRQLPRRGGERGSAVGAGGSSPPWRLIVGHLPRGRPRALDPGGGGG